MIVEHVFITTLEAPDALRLASQFLATRGFEAIAQGAFAMGPQGWNVLEMSRGKKNPGKAKSVVQFPQQVRLEWDRGRVTVAASAMSLVESRATTVGKLKGKPLERQREMLMAIATQLEHLLAIRREPHDVIAAWSQIEGEIDQRDRAHRRRNKTVALTIVLLALTGLGVVIYFAATSR
jgi:hypothetical protein